MNARLTRVSGPSAVRRRGSSRRAGLLIVMLLLGSVFLIPPTPSSSRALDASAVSTAMPPIEAKAVAPVAWQPCAPGDVNECATYLVPLDHARPAGPRISIALLRVPATDPARRIGSLFVNPGGPGGSGIDFARGVAPAVSPAVRARFDIVGFDPRGVARSSPIIDCPPFAVPPTAPIVDFPSMVAQHTIMQGTQDNACQVSLARTGRYYSTRQVASDLDLLRQAVGDAKLTYWGGSYGTRLGMVYAQLFGQNVRALVLDGAVDPASTQLTFMGERGGSYDSAFAFFRSRYPVAGAAFEAVADRLRTAGPVTINLEGTPQVIGFGEFTAEIHGFLGNESAWPTLSDALLAFKAVVIDGVPIVVTPPAPGSIPPSDPIVPPGPPAPGAANLETVLRQVNCLDLPGPPNFAQMVATAQQMNIDGPLYGGLMSVSLMLCQGFTIPTDFIPTSPPVGIPPVVVIGSRYDPATPYFWAQRMNAFIPRSVLVTYEGAQHVAWNGPPSACVGDTIDAYVVNLTVPPLGLQCPFIPPV